MNGLVDNAIIGAGPYGLSLAAHLHAAGIPFRIFGRPMEAWKKNMPPGMLLKSRISSSSLYHPEANFTIEQFYQERGMPCDGLTAPPVETFIAYGEAFQARFVPNVEPKLLAQIEPAQEGFCATFDDGEVVRARRVVLAVGIHPFKYVPEPLSDLPAEVSSHSGDYGPLDSLVGKKVAVLGSGASATDLAALLHEKGASVVLIARASKISFVGSPKERSLLRRCVKFMSTPLYPPSGIGSGWLLKICADAPGVFHTLPDRWRLHIAYNTLGPKGHDSTRDRVIGKVQLLTGRRVASAEVSGSKVNLDLVSRNGTCERLQVDHVVAATGYKIDLRKFGFLDQALLSEIKTLQGGPVLSSNYESSVAGLYFVGPASLNSFGPVVRFVYGAMHSSRRLTRHFSGSAYTKSLATGLTRGIPKAGQM